jgi:hypothetical protein
MNIARIFRVAYARAGKTGDEGPAGMWKARFRHEKRGNILWKTLWKVWITFAGYARSFMQAPFGKG